MGEPIKDIAEYIQSVDESLPKKDPPLIPPLFSIRELSILLTNMTRIYRDPLTGALVRRAIIKILAREMVRAEKEEFSLVVALFDVDEFTQFNDHNGYLAGDALLQRISSCIQEKLVEGEFLGRWGGDKFLVISTRINDKTILNHYDKIREYISYYLQGNAGKSLPITVSVGAAIFVFGQTEDDLIKLAERALSQAKKERRSCLSGQPLVKD
ncbi:MAG: GGDEF domain-containing protein [Leptospirillia bacterium]